MLLKYLKKFIANRVKKTTISSIVNGDIIMVSDKNIFVNDTIFEDDKFEAKCQFCNKELYYYQINAFNMIRQLELTDSFELKMVKLFIQTDIYYIFR